MTNMTFPELLDALAEMPSIPCDALEQITETLRENFPTLLDSWVDEGV